MVEVDFYRKIDSYYQRSEIYYRMRMQSQIGQVMSKVMAFLNGGSILSLLTFLGDENLKDGLLLFKNSIYLHIVGLIFAICAYFISFLSQAPMANIEKYRIGNAQHRVGVGAEVQRSAIYAMRRRKFLYLVICIVVLSMVLFVGGCASALNGIAEATSSKQTDVR